VTAYVSGMAVPNCRHKLSFEKIVLKPLIIFQFLTAHQKASVQSFLYDSLASLVLNIFYMKTHPLPGPLWKLILLPYTTQCSF